MFYKCNQRVLEITDCIELCLKGSSSVILLRPKIGLAPQKHDIISMPRQQYTNTKYIPIEHRKLSFCSFHYTEIYGPKKPFGENLLPRSENRQNRGGDLP